MLCEIALAKRLFPSKMSQQVPFDNSNFARYRASATFVQSSAYELISFIANAIIFNAKS